MKGTITWIAVKEQLPPKMMRVLWLDGYDQYIHFFSLSYPENIPSHFTHWAYINYPE